MNIIASVDKNRGIGSNGDLLVHISEDLKNFKKMTTGNSIIMGRKTLDSFKGGKPLPNRENIVITREKDFSKEGVIVYNSIEKLLEDIDIDDDKYFVVGGGQIYKQLIDYCNTLYLTLIDETFEADTFFPEYEDKYKKVIEDIEIHEGNFSYRRAVFKKLAK